MWLTAVSSVIFSLFDDEMSVDHSLHKVPLAKAATERLIAAINDNSIGEGRAAVVVNELEGLSSHLDGFKDICALTSRPFDLYTMTKRSFVKLSDPDDGADETIRLLPQSYTPGTFISRIKSEDFDAEGS